MAPPRRAPQAEALLRIAGRAARIGAWFVSLHDRALLWSEETANIHDEPPGPPHPIEKSLSYYLPGHREKVAAAFEACAGEGRPFDLESEILTAKGRRVWVRTIGEAVRDESGLIVAVQGACQDVTDARASREQLARLADRLYETLESLSDAFYTVDRDWRFVYLNPRAETILRAPREKLIGRILWEEYPEAVGTGFHEAFLRAVATDKPTVVEEYYPPFDAWFEAKAFPAPSGLAVQIRDTTVARRAAEVLRASEERFRLLARATSDAIWDWDLVTDSIWRNEAFAHLFGIDPREDASLAPWRERVHPEDLPRVEETVRRSLVSGDRNASCEYRLRRADGSYAAVLDRWSVIRDAGGKAVRLIGGMSDQTPRVEAQERMRRQAELLDKASDAVLLRGLDHRVLYWNDGAERIYGWSRAEALGRPVTELLYAGSRDFEAAHAALLAKGKWSGELLQRRKDGTAIRVQAHWTLIRDASGKPESVLAMNALLAGTA
jgi:PAS domain S-box-containing protein